MAEALLTRMSMPPKVLTVASMQAWTCSSFLMSTMKGSAWPPAASTTWVRLGRFIKSNYYYCFHPFSFFEVSNLDWFFYANVSYYSLFSYWQRCHMFQFVVSQLSHICKRNGAHLLSFLIRVICMVTAWTNSLWLAWLYLIIWSFFKSSAILRGENRPFSFVRRNIIQYNV